MGGLDVDRRRPPHPRQLVGAERQRQADHHYEVGFEPPAATRNVDGHARRRWTGLDHEHHVPGAGAGVQRPSAAGPWSARQVGRDDRPAARRSRVSRGRSRGRQPGCGTSDCAYFHITASGMAPNTDYQVNCYGDDGSGMQQFDTGTSYVGSGPAGNISQDASCYWGYPGRPVYATLNGIRSSTSTW